MKDFKLPNLPDPNRFTQRLHDLRQDLMAKKPEQLAAWCESGWIPSGTDSGLFQVTFWGRPYEITYPDGMVCKQPSGEPASPMEQAMLLYYLVIADGTPLANQWISFSELPDGKFYVQAFNGYTGKELTQKFGNDLAAFERAAENLGGKKHTLGNAAFRFTALPRVPLLVVYWLGDEEFSASAQVLFDTSASHYLTTDAYAILGSTITRKLIAQYKG